jgi:hypothetical protein
MRKYIIGYLGRLLFFSFETVEYGELFQKQNNEDENGIARIQLSERKKESKIFFVTSIFKLV